jgi:hypothetical protein
MKRMQMLWHGAAWLAVSAMCLPNGLVLGNETGAQGAPAATLQPTAGVHDVALQPGGLLIGQVLDATLQPMHGATVALYANGKTTATMTTDANGVFAVTGLRGGMHQVGVGNSVENCRLWAAGTAPPHAVSQLRFVPGQSDLVRGQWGPPPSYNAVMGWVTNPWVIGGVVATAIAVPVILHNIDDDEDEGS